MLPCSLGLRPRRTVIVAAHPADLPRELGAPAVDPRFDRAFRQLQPVGDLLIRQLLNVPHQHRRPQRLGQRRQRLPQQHHAILLLDRRDRSRLVRHRRQLVRVDLTIDRLALLTDAAVVIDAQVTADADEPGLKIRAPIERAERLEDLQEDVLRQIFGFLVPADELVRDVEDFPPVLLDDRVPGELVALKTSLNERFNFPRPPGASDGGVAGRSADIKS